MWPRQGPPQGLPKVAPQSPPTSGPAGSSPDGLTGFSQILHIFLTSLLNERYCGDKMWRNESYLTS